MSYFNYKNSHSLNFGLGKPYLEDHFNIFSSDINAKYFDYFVYVDSKGSNLSFPKKSWVFNLIQKFIFSNKSYLIVSRPKELTTFFSLINFLNLNVITYNILITNVGFVDLTPKKLIFINDIILQNPFKSISLKSKFLSKYFDEKNDPIDLHNIIINKQITILISDFISRKFKNVFLLESFEFDNSINIKRKRPDCFFKCLNKTNNLLFQLTNFNSNLNVIKFKTDEIINFSDVSFDAVHYTDFGHEIVYNKVIKSLNLK